MILELALQLGYASPSRMLREMRLAELVEWMAFFRLSPWGQSRADLRMGIIASTIANVNRDGKKRPRTYRPGEFMPYVERDEAREQAELRDRLLVAFGHDPKALDPKRVRRKKKGK